MLKKLNDEIIEKILYSKREKLIIKNDFDDKLSKNTLNWINSYKKINNIDLFIKYSLSVIIIASFFVFTTWGSLIYAYSKKNLNINNKNNLIKTFCKTLLPSFSPVSYNNCLDNVCSELCCCGSSDCKNCKGDK